MICDLGECRSIVDNSIFVLRLATVGLPTISSVESIFQIEMQLSPVTEPV